MPLNYAAASTTPVASRGAFVWISGALVALPAIGSLILCAREMLFVSPPAGRGNLGLLAAAPAATLLALDFASIVLRSRLATAAVVFILTLLTVVMVAAIANRAQSFSEFAALAFVLVDIVLALAGHLHWLIRLTTASGSWPCTPIQLRPPKS